MSWLTLGDDAHVLDSKDLMLLRKYLIFIQKEVKATELLIVRDGVIRFVLWKDNSGSFVMDRLEQWRARGK